MNYLKKLKTISLAMMALCFSATVTMAQQVSPAEIPLESSKNISEEEIKTFVKINKDIIPLQESTQTDMISTIKENGLEVPRFQEMAEAQQGGKLKEVSNDPKELESFSRAGEKIMKLQEELEAEVAQVIVKNEMSPEKFESIYMAYNSDPQIKQKIDKLFSEDT